MGEHQRGGKRQFLVHIDSTLIRRVKILALDRGVSASSLVQQSLEEFLAREQGDTANAPETDA